MPTLPARHDTAYIFGAICPSRGVGAAVITPAADMECMNLYLAEISTQVAPGSVAAVICDGAGWHQRGGEITLPDNIILLSLPPYAPEFNPMQNVWDYLRANKLLPASEIITTISCKPVPTLGTGLSLTMIASAQSVIETGQRSMSKTVGITYSHLEELDRRPLLAGG